MIWEQWVYYGEQWLSQNMAAAVPEPVQFQPALISQPQPELDIDVVKENIETE